MLIGDWFKMRRDLMGLTQDAMAESLGVTPATYRNWERNRTDPQVKLWQVPSVARAFGVMDEELLAAAEAGRAESERMARSAIIGSIVTNINKRAGDRNDHP
jgi:DNA-binding XRE family transcriptional regulator